MESIIDAAEVPPEVFRDSQGQDGGSITASGQEKLNMIKELDAAIKRRYHQSLDEVLRDLYVHNVISKQDLSVEEILRALKSISVLKTEVDSVLKRYRH
jgi:hypothetical protein